MKTIQKVMLLKPPVRCSPFYELTVCQPMGLAYLAAVLKNRYEVFILDSVLEDRKQERKIKWDYIEIGLSYEQIAEKVKEFAPQVLGISCLFSSQLPVVQDICERVKRDLPSLITVTGGAHPSFMPADSLSRCPHLDYIILGEGEESFPLLLDALEKDGDIKQIDGLAWRENGTSRINPKTRFIENLDSIPFPARELLKMETYFDINLPFWYYSKSPRNVSFITSRGCPFNCRFCSSCNYWGNRIRFRSVENCIEEMRELKYRWGVEELKFEEDNLLLNKDNAKRLFRTMIQEKLDFHWNMPNGALIMSLLDEELVSLMKESGCYEVHMAFESGDQYVLDNIIKKPLDLSKAERAVSILRANDIDVHAIFIVGFPEETRRQISNTFRFASRMKLDKSYFFIFNPLPGTDLYRECLEKKLFDPESIFYNDYFNSPIKTENFNADSLRKRVYFYTIYQNLFLLFRNPGKLFGKYLKRVLSKNSFKALTRAISSVIYSLFNKKT